MNLKIKIVTGFRADQHYTIDAEEAHKAYYLFLHPEERGIFSDGTALIGRDIRGVDRDYNATMGWAPSYQLTAEDWAEIRASGIDRQLRDVLLEAKQIGATGNKALMALPLSEAKTKLLV